MFNTDVTAGGAKVAGVGIPSADQVTNSYPIALASHTTNRATGQAFVAFLTSAPAQGILRPLGFLAP